MVFWGAGVDTAITGLNLSLEVAIPKNILDSAEWGKLVEQHLPAMAGEARDFWISEAGRRLQTSRQEYQDAIVLESITGDSFSLSLVGGFLPLAIELGTDAYDMKPGLAGKIVPLNVDRLIVMTKPKVFRTCSPNSSGWQHPGFEGMKLHEEVVREIEEVLIPKYIDMIVEGL